MENRDARSLSSAAQEALRRRAVKAVLGGKKQVEVAEVFGVTRQAVGRWMKAYGKGGEKALRQRPQGRPNGGSLDQKQQNRIMKVVVDQRPEQLKLPFYLWTRDAVSQLIEQKFGLKLSVWTVGRYLLRWGFTPQRPIRRAFEQSSLQVQRWLEEEYPAIKHEAQKAKAEIFWGDEMGLRSDHASGRTYGLCGVTPVIPITGNRFSCNMISALNNRGVLYFMVFKQRFKADVFLDFLRRLVHQAGRKVFLIVDGHPVHRSRKVKKWLKKYEAKIRLYLLPLYSPELNPDEYLNQDVKTNAAGRRRSHSQQEMISNLRSYLRSRQRRPQLVRKYFHAPKVKYAA
jgi:transposase